MIGGIKLTSKNIVLIFHNTFTNSTVELFFASCRRLSDGKKLKMYVISRAWEKVLFGYSSLIQVLLVLIREIHGNLKCL